MLALGHQASTPVMHSMWHYVEKKTQRSQNSQQTDMAPVTISAAPPTARPSKGRPLLLPAKHAACLGTPA